MGTHAEEIARLVAAADALADRTAAIADLRRQAGRSLSTGRRSELKEAAAALRQAAGRLDDLARDPSDEEARRELRTIAASLGLMG